MMKRIPIVIFICALFLPTLLMADDFDFNRMEMSFKNFIHCELTRNDGHHHFKGKPFKINMITLFDVQNESDLKIVTGVVKCFVVDTYHTLYVALGLKSVMGKEQVRYYTIRDKDFSVLATELIKFPYKENCSWAQYHLDTN